MKEDLTRKDSRICYRTYWNRGVFMGKRIAAIALSSMIAVTGLSVMSAGVSAEWVKNGGSYSYKDEAGNKLTGWQEIDGGRYCFDKDGKAFTGRKKINGDTYYFIASKKGKMATSWLTVNGRRYYFGNDGIMRTGWTKIDGKKYYFGADGAMRTGKIKISGKVYTFGTDGVLKNSSENTFLWGMTSDELTDMFDEKDIVYYWNGERLYTDIDGEIRGYGFNSKDELTTECLYRDGDDMKNIIAGLRKDGYKKDYEETDEDGDIAYVFIKKDSAVITGYLSDMDVTMAIYLSPEASAQLAEVGYEHLEEVDM